MQADDSYWRQPDPSHAEPTASGNADRPMLPDRGQPSPQPLATPGFRAPQGSRARPGSPAEPTSQPYSPPPPTTPPPAGWHPEHVVEPPPPRRLPPQDDERIDQEEARARTVTLWTGIVVSVILVALLCLLCGRMLA